MVEIADPYKFEDSDEEEMSDSSVSTHVGRWRDQKNSKANASFGKCHFCL